jgi:hypothetical protein
VGLRKLKFGSKEYCYLETLDCHWPNHGPIRNGGGVRTLVRRQSGVENNKK